MTDIEGTFRLREIQTGNASQPYILECPPEIAQVPEGHLLEVFKDDEWVVWSQPTDEELYERIEHAAHDILGALDELRARV
jgi:hypothetical protein